MSELTSADVTAAVANTQGGREGDDLRFPILAAAPQTPQTEGTEQCRSISPELRRSGDTAPLTAQSANFSAASAQVCPEINQRGSGGPEPERGSPELLFV